MLILEELFHQTKGPWQFHFNLTGKMSFTFKPDIMVSNIMCSLKSDLTMTDK